MDVDVVLTGESDAGEFVAAVEASRSLLQPGSTPRTLPRASPPTWTGPPVTIRPPT